jgi:hypothetical protein
MITDYSVQTSVSLTPRVRFPRCWDTDQGHRPSRDLDNRVGKGHGAENQRSIDVVGGFHSGILVQISLPMTSPNRTCSVPSSPSFRADLG